MFNHSKATLGVYRQPETVSPGAVLTRATGQIAVNDAKDIRIETWNGREYTVVPVVAIVEGVLQGANSTGPEFASAEEFGKFPKAWDGRPVVMNHPQLNGVFVTASIPEVLEGFGMGMIFNSRVEEDKLKCEAWLDHERIEEMGGEALSTLERIRNNEIVEVSVGAWLSVAKRNGTYNGKSYVGVWQNVAPDHLAFLSEGTKGACSIEDGCGVPRLFSVNHATIGGQANCCDACAEGRSCEAAEPTSDDGVEQLAQLQQTEKNLRELLSLVEDSSSLDEAFELSVNTIPDDIELGDLKVIVWQGLLEALDLPPYDLDLVAWTPNAVVYYQYGRSGLHMRTYEVDESGNIEFSGTDIPVNLLTKILPRQTKEPSVAQENNMPGNQTGEDNGEIVVETPEAGAGDDPGQVTEQVDNPSEEVTLESLLSGASPALRESIESGVKVHARMKEHFIKALDENELCPFSRSQLEKKSLDELEMLGQMAKVPSYAGVALPAEAEGISTNSEEAAGPKVAKAPTNYLAPSENVSAE